MLLPIHAYDVAAVGMDDGLLQAVCLLYGQVHPATVVMMPMVLSSCASWKC